MGALRHAHGAALALRRARQWTGAAGGADRAPDPRQLRHHGAQHHCQSPRHLRTTGANLVSGAARPIRWHTPSPLVPSQNRNAIIKKDVTMMFLDHLNLLRRDVATWNQWRTQHQEILPDLAETDLSNLSLRGADLSAANLFKANLQGALLEGANLCGALLWSANLYEAVLCGANASEAMLSRADLSGADLRRARLDRAHLYEANLSDCLIDGLSVHDAELMQSQQANLHFVEDGAVMTIDDLEMAQFVSLALHSRILQRCGRIVLIAGAFRERAGLLVTLKEALAASHYVPLTFDLAQSHRAERLLTLARLARFLLLDLTDLLFLPVSVQTLIRQKTLPIQPLLDVSEERACRCREIAPSPWVLPTYRYRGLAHLHETVQERLIAPAEEVLRAWR